jgi:DNA-directed RNA polymerase subunit H (RpoH/RPB5)
MYRLFDIKKTQLEMVRDRGYDISPEEEPILGMTLAQFAEYGGTLARANPRASARSLLSRSYMSKRPDGSTRKMLVYYGGRTSPQQKQVSIEIVREFIGLIHRYEIHEAILIVDAVLSSLGDTELSALTLTKWQVFFDSELTYNPTQAEDTPKHELLSEEAGRAKLRELRVDASKLLIMKLDDPVVRYYGWSAGRIVRVYRDDSAISILAPKTINYRIIVG